MHIQFSALGDRGRSSVDEGHRGIHILDPPVIRIGDILQQKFLGPVIGDGRQLQLLPDGFGSFIRFAPHPDLYLGAGGQIIPDPAGVRYGQPDTAVAGPCAQVVVFLNDQGGKILFSVQNGVEISPGNDERPVLGGIITAGTPSGDRCLCG